MPEIRGAAAGLALETLDRVVAKLGATPQNSSTRADVSSQNESRDRSEGERHTDLITLIGLIRSVPS